MSRKGLGKGLDALISESTDIHHVTSMSIEISRIRPNPKQPRQEFDAVSLAELTESIREHGVIQPVLVRPAGHGYELVAGERRWRAAQAAGLQMIPAVVRDLASAQVLEIALIENLQRQDLNPIEEAEAYQALISEFGLTQEDLGKRLGRSRPHIANTVRLLGLPTSVQRAVAGGEVSVGHAKVLLGLANSAQMEELAEEVVRTGLSVRDTEARLGRIRDQDKPELPEVRDREARDPEVVSWEARLREILAAPVRIVGGAAKGRIEISFYGAEDLTRLLEALSGGEGERGPLGPGGTRRLTV